LSFDDVSNGRFEVSLLPEVSRASVLRPYRLGFCSKTALAKAARTPSLPFSHHGFRRCIGKPYYDMHVIATNVEGQQLPTPPKAMFLDRFADNLPRGIRQPVRLVLHSPL